MKKLIKPLLSIVLTLMACASLQAASFTFVWVPGPQAPAPHNYPRVTCVGTFTVDATVVNSGQIAAADVTGLFVHMGSPANYTYRVFDNGFGTTGVFTCAVGTDPDNGQPVALITDGTMHSTCLFSTYGRNAIFSANAIAEVNTAGGSWHGSWVGVYNP